MCLDIRLSLRVCDIVVRITAVDPAAHVYSHLVAIHYTSAPAGSAYGRQACFLQPKIPRCAERQRIPSTVRRYFVGGPHLTNDHVP